MFLQGGDFDVVVEWVGMCLVMFIGVLLVGNGGYCNFWFNFGYGVFGFILVCGSGCLLVEQIGCCLLSIDIFGLFLCGVLVG